MTTDGPRTSHAEGQREEVMNLTMQRILIVVSVLFSSIICIIFLVYSLFGTH